MRKFLIVAALGALMAPLFASQAQAGAVPASPHVGMWRDEFGDPVDAYVEALPGETIRVYYEINDEHGYWAALDRIRVEMWWDETYIESGSATTGPRAAYDYDEPVDSVTSGQYYAPEDNSDPQFSYFLKVDLWYGNMYMYDDLRVVGFDIPIRADAPAGTTSIGSNLIGTDLWTGGCCHWYEEIAQGDEWALTIEVLSVEPACGIGDADCDGDVDLDDIIAAVGNFTGPCADGVDCFGDPGNGASVFSKIRAEGDVNNGVPVVGTEPLQGDGDVDLDDIIDMVGSFTGPLDSEEYVAAASAGDAGLPDLRYDSVTGEVFLDGSDIGGGLQAYNIKNAGGGILNGNFTAILGGPPATDLPTEIGEFQLSSTATPPGGLSIGLVFPAGMDQAQLEAFVTGGSAAPSFGGGSFAWELIAFNVGPGVPEPATVTLLAIGLMGLALVGYRRRRAA